MIVNNYSNYLFFEDVLCNQEKKIYGKIIKVNVYIMYYEV